MQINDHVLVTLNWGSGNSVYEVHISEVRSRSFSGLYRCPDNPLYTGDWIGPGAFSFNEIVKFETLGKSDE
mgnify:FL=1